MLLDKDSHVQPYNNFYVMGSVIIDRLGISARIAITNRIISLDFYVHRVQAPKALTSGITVQPDAIERALR